MTQSGRWTPGRSRSVGRPEGHGKAGDLGLRYGEQERRVRMSSVVAQPRILTEYSAEQCEIDKVPLAAGAIARRKDQRYWISLQAVLPGDILSTSAALEPERYRENAEQEVVNRIVRLVVMHTHPHRAMDAEFGKFFRNERDLSTVDQSCEGFVATALELRKMYHRVRFHCQKWFGVEGARRAGVEMFRIFTLLNVLTPETMI